MKKLLLTLIMSVVFVGTIFAQWYPSDESYNPNNYDTYFDVQYPFNPGNFEMPDYPNAFLECNGALITDQDRWADYEVGAFVGEELRGFCFMTNLYVEMGYLPMFEGIFVYYNESGESISFRVYDHATGQEYECTTNFEIVTGDDSNHYGTYDDPDGTSGEALIISFTAESAQTFTKDITGYGEGNGNWYLISSPIGNVDISGPDQLVGLGLLATDSSFDLFYFDESKELEWINYQQEDYSLGFDTLEKGKGYLYASQVSTTLTFTGTAYSGDSTVTLNKTGVNQKWDGWNLIGNPFADTVYIDRDFYTMNDGGTEILATPVSRGIAPMEGVFVVAETDGETITFFTSGSGGGGFDDGEIFKTLTLNLNDGRSLIDRAIVRFGEGRQLPKFQLRSNSTKVYIPKDGSDYAIVRSEGMGEMPVNFKAEKNGTYSLVLGSENVSFSYLHLIDNLTGADVDLLANPGYTFEASTTDYASRFRLVFATGSSNDDNFAFFSNGSLIVNNDGKATVQVIDVNGRVLSSESINGSASVSVKGAAGVYMVRLINGDNVKVQKIVVR